MHVVDRVIDWLKAPDATVHTLLEDVRSPNGDSLAVLAVAAMQLEQQVGLEPPSSSAVAALSALIEGLPPQTAYVDLTSPFGQWLNFAALAEHLGAARLAQVMVDKLRERIPRTHSQVKVAEDDLAEWRSICWSRRARLSRVAGALDDAVECYRDALACAPRGWKDARPIATLGLCMVAASRGNYPAVVRHATVILAVKRSVSPVYRIPAHQIRALALRKQGRLVAALLDAWAAHDLLDRDDHRKAESIGSLSEIAVEAGDYAAASNGFTQVLLSDPPQRIVVSARIGFLGAQTQIAQRSAEHPGNHVEAAFASLLALLAEPLPPRDELRVLIAVLEAGALLGRIGSDMTAWLARSEELAQRHGYFEQQFQLEACAKKMRGERNCDSAPIKPRDGATSASSRHPLLARLFQLA